MSQDENLKSTPLDALHRELGAKMVAFTGYSMPVHYPAGVLKEHLHTRSKASIFDVSHMGQVRLTGENPAAAIEKLVPGDIQGLAVGKARYTLLTNDSGGIIDDLMVTQAADHLYLVVNAACKDADFAHIENNLGDGYRMEILHDQALIALQGPAAVEVLSRFIPAARHMLFMTAEAFNLGDIPCFVTRSGYTGEDGYEISVPADQVEDLTRLLLGEDEVEMAGLGARDSLRLEAGLCLYGSDIDTATTPIEAGLIWTVNKCRRETGGFPGADIILGQIKDGVSRKRVGILPDGKAPARAHTEIMDSSGEKIGEITSGGFGPSVGGPVAMGYVDIEHAKPDTPVQLKVRNKRLPAKIVKLPFVKQNYFHG